MDAGQTPLARQVWPEVRASLLLVPLGSTEQHGPHLPLDTDARIATAIATGAAARIGEAVTVAPTLPYGASGEHADFSGTLSIGQDALRFVIVELTRSAALTFDQVAFVNGHGGNVAAVTQAVEQLVAEGHRVASWSPRVPDGDAHAGRTETSLMLAIDPDVVRLEHAEAGNTAPVGELIAELRRSGVKGVSRNGVLGDPAGASSREGSALLATLIDDLTNDLTQALEQL